LLSSELYSLKVIKVKIKRYPFLRLKKCVFYTKMWSTEYWYRAGYLEKIMIWWCIGLMDRYCCLLFQPAKASELNEVVVFVFKDTFCLLWLVCFVFYNLFCSWFIWLGTTKVFLFCIKFSCFITKYTVLVYSF
jgi:hypothetical protein